MASGNLGNHASGVSTACWRCWTSGRLADDAAIAEGTWNPLNIVNLGNVGATTSASRQRRRRQPGRGATLRQPTSAVATRRAEPGAGQPGRQRRVRWASATVGSGRGAAGIGNIGLGNAGAATSASQASYRFGNGRTNNPDHTGTTRPGIEPGAGNLGLFGNSGNGNIEVLRGCSTRQLATPASVTVNGQYRGQCRELQHGFPATVLQHRQPTWQHQHRLNSWQCRLSNAGHADGLM